MADQNSTIPKPSLSDHEDGDEPLLFKRHNTASKAKGKMAPLRAIPKASTSSPVSSYDQSKQLPEQIVPSASAKHPAPAEENSDSDDEKPLCAFMKAGSDEAGDWDSEDDDNQPLSSRYLKGKGKTPKRPLDHQTNISEQSSAKKPKVLGSHPKNKQVSSPKHEPEVDYDDSRLAHRMRKARSVNKSSLTTKKKVPKISSSSNTIKKGKKPDKVSKDQPSSKSDNKPKKWTSLVHNGVVFPPPYEPHGVKMLYNGKPVDLTTEQEEVATMFAMMTDTDYVNKRRFRDNFWMDWSKLLGEEHVIQNLDACNFQPIYEWWCQEKEKKKQMSMEEKKAVKEEKLKQEEKYKWATIDGVKEEVQSFRVEPPGLFRGRGEQPQSGRLKRRIVPSDITINIGKDAPVPECPIPGKSWKQIRHDNTVSWLACWDDPISEEKTKYVMLGGSSSLRGQSDKDKFEKARELKDYINDIRTAYTRAFTIPSKEDGANLNRQIAVATYLIDRFALRAGNKKDVNEEADTVGCCTLKVENVKAIAPNLLEFDFLGKDSIKYHQTHQVELPVYKAIKQFQNGKSSSDKLFDQLDTNILNAHLKELMPGLTAKVFRTYNASITLDNMLNEKTKKEGDVSARVEIYKDANKKVAILCNHQRTEPKTFGEQISKLNKKIEDLKGVMKDLETDLVRERKGKSPLNRKQKKNLTPDVLEKKMAQTAKKIEAIESKIADKEDNKNVALETSKVNYLDPRITVAWCKRHEVPIQKIFSKIQLKKFAWAMDVDPDFRF
ncbi:DNA topoisomerase 1 alpha-like [Rosa rugosa]|uniref:DNA topoisomerase 1 alpha-like n=1 Tax=Rosa rugosa TaxID=74645 RepID=UPI002B40FFEA|nr:DNA topoisomerase 1 alpha-like [Rosa rugosa]